MSDISDTSTNAEPLPVGHVAPIAMQFPTIAAVPPVPFGDGVLETKACMSTTGTSKCRPVELRCRSYMIRPTAGPPVPGRKSTGRRALSPKLAMLVEYSGCARTVPPPVTLATVSGFSAAAATPADAATTSSARIAISAPARDLLIAWLDKRDMRPCSPFVFSCRACDGQGR